MNRIVIISLIIVVVVAILAVGFLIYWKKYKTGTATTPTTTSVTTPTPTPTPTLTPTIVLPSQNPLIQALSTYTSLQYMWDQDDLQSHHPPYDGFLVSKLLQTDAQGHYQMTLVGYKRQGTSICANPPYSQDLTLLMSLQNNNNVSHLVSSDGTIDFSLGQKPDANTQQFQISVTGSSPIFVVGRSLYSGTLVNLYVKTCQ